MKEISSLTYKILQISMLSGIGPAALRKLTRLEKFEELSVGDMACHLPALSRALSVSSEWANARRKADEQVKKAISAQSTIISALDPGYPTLLKETKDDPCVLYIKGHSPLPAKKVVGVIGTRSPTKHGRIIAERITEYLAANDISILSGLALGCDTIAHESAILSSAHTVAVLAHGLQTIAPASNKDLARRILDSGGTLLTEYPFGTEPRPVQFVKRDKTQAGIADGVIMIQSDTKGGSLHASRAALKYGRWLAVPFPTASDIQAHEPKIQANLIISGVDADMKRSLLEVEYTKALGRLIILRSKDDYMSLPLKNQESRSIPSKKDRDAESLGDCGLRSPYANHEGVEGLDAMQLGLSDLW